MAPRPAPPRLQGPELLRAVRGRLTKGYGPGSLGLRLHDAKSDVFALMCEVERLTAEIADLGDELKVRAAG